MDDVDMDAPQISTLHDEESPPPAPRPFRVKLVFKDKASTSVPRSAPTEDEEDEVDQLIDEDETPAKLNPIVIPPRKVPAKRKPRKSEKRPTAGVAEDEGRLRERIIPSGSTASTAPSMSWFEANPQERQQEPGHDAPLDPKVSRSSRKPTAPRARTKPYTRPAKPILPPLLADDSGMASESFAGTAASSPVTAPLEINSPEPEPPLYPVAPPQNNEEINLESNPVPVYPLPTKPFPVQPPPKIATGFAPPITMDRSIRHAKVRTWRVANREIRGIGGGRWFARSWVGARDSEFSIATSTTASLKNFEAHGVAIPKLPALSISAPAGKTSSGKSRTKATSSLATSAAPSRSGSADIASVRAPTKMRTVLHAPASEAGDSDMLEAPGH
ncbi:hypothetical protein C8J56DRAFT_919694 [Mycena floridula]|nr:hypothetical protein C8J56DRAFT_919694 [Mycena floridula]